jgi:1-deoxy-D-xylulose-5-phosphate reductoisomerase
VCNAANEIAVAAFLDRQIRFTDIPLVIERTLEQVSIVEPATLSVVEAADAEARDLACGFLADVQKQASTVNRI